MQPEIMEAYNAFWGGPVPYASVLWMVCILIISLLALWQARVFIKDF